MIDYVPDGAFCLRRYIAYTKPKNADYRRIHFAREVYTTDKNKTKRALYLLFYVFFAYSAVVSGFCRGRPYAQNYAFRQYNSARKQKDI